MKSFSGECTLLSSSYDLASRTFGSELVTLRDASKKKGLQVWNGHSWVGCTVEHIGKNKMIDVEFSNGVIIGCDYDRPFYYHTTSHKFTLPANRLISGMTVPGIKNDEYVIVKGVSILKEDQESVDAYIINKSGKSDSLVVNGILVPF